MTFYVLKKVSKKLLNCSQGKLFAQPDREIFAETSRWALGRKWFGFIKTEKQLAKYLPCMQLGVVK